MDGPLPAPQASSPRAQPQLIEQTGKLWKGGQLIFGALCVLGVVTMFAGSFSNGFWILFAGAVGVLVSRAGAWWNHG